MGHAQAGAQGSQLYESRNYRSGQTARRVNFTFYHQANLCIAVIEEKGNKHSVGSGMQQSLSYAEALDLALNTLAASADAVNDSDLCANIYTD